MVAESKQAHGGEERKPQDQLHIFVNRRRFSDEDGVRKVMKGREIAKLVDVPEDVAVIRRGTSGDSPIVGVDEEIRIRSGEHFLVTRKVVEGGSGGDQPPDRLARELELLHRGGQAAEYHVAERPAVVYRNLPTSGKARGLPAATDVLVPVPPGYPASMIDLAGLPIGSPLLPLVKGGSNNQGVVTVGGVGFQLASYHPHNNGGGPPWDQNRHGFHTYVDHLLSWLAAI